MGQDYLIILETYGTSEQVRAEPMLWETSRWLMDDGRWMMCFEMLDVYKMDDG